MPSIHPPPLAAAAVPAHAGALLRNCLACLGTGAERRYLLSAITISMVVHGVLLALHFRPTPPTRPPRHDAGLEVVLLNAGTRAAPAKPQMLAQVNSQGGGNAADGHARAPVARSAANRDGQALAELRRRQAELEAQQRLLAAELAQRRLASQPAPHAAPAPAQPGADTQAQRLERQYAEISRRIEDYNKRPRLHFYAPSTSEYRYAAYVDQWRRRIETLGTRHYPSAARGKVYGSLRMTVYIRSDGSLEGVDIDQPSEHKILNDAARRIVALATPFAPFPPQIARDTDVLAITRTWYFTNDKLIAKSG